MDRYQEVIVGEMPNNGKYAFQFQVFPKNHRPLFVKGNYLKEIKAFVFRHFGICHGVMVIKRTKALIVTIFSDPTTIPPVKIETYYRQKNGVIKNKFGSSRVCGRKVWLLIDTLSSAYKTVFRRLPKAYLTQFDSYWYQPEQPISI